MTSAVKWRVGTCLVCDQSIAETCQACGIFSKSPNYTEVEIQWSNGCKMNIAICLRCSVDHTWTSPRAKQKIKEAHWDTWDKEGGKYDPEVFIV